MTQHNRRLRNPEQADRDRQQDDVKSFDPGALTVWQVPRQRLSLAHP